MEKVVPSLSTMGWLTSLQHRADALIAYYITSEHSQSYLYSDRVISLTYHIQQYGNTPKRLEERVSRDVETYLRRYFDDATVNATTKIPDVNDPNRLNLTLEIFVTEQGRGYSLGREIMSVNQRVVKVFDINNMGSVE